MNEIKETLAILKTRWHEVSLLLGLWFLFRLTTLIFGIYPEHMKLIQVVTFSLSLIALVVSMGFLRTVYLEPDRRQSLLDLIRIGKHFFLRFLVLGLLGGAVMMLPYWLLSICGVKGGALNHNAGLFMKLLLAKLTLLIPAIIIVTDCSIPKSFSLMWKTKLFQAKAKPLLIFFLITKIVLPTLMMLLFSNIFRAHSSINWSDAIRTFYHVASSVMGLMLSVMAIRFVSSLEITDNNI
jgi:hypothetical protein